jgi:hypothetical protein
LLVSELIGKLLNADPDRVVLYLDSHADVEESNESCEVSVDSSLRTLEKGVCHGERYEKRYPYGHRASDGEGREVIRQALKCVVVLSDGPTNLRHVTSFRPNKRQQELAERALASHRWAQAFCRYARSRLVRKWTSEKPVPANTDTFSQRKKRRFLGISGLKNRGLMTVPLAVRHATGWLLQLDCACA